MLLINSPLVHFSGLNREGAELHNARYALVSGLAHGLQKSLLMLGENKGDGKTKGKTKGTLVLKQLST